MAGQHTRCLVCENSLSKWERHLLEHSENGSQAFIAVPLRLLHETMPFLPEKLKGEVREWIKSS